MTTYQTAIDAVRQLKAKFGNTWAEPFQNWFRYC